MSKRVSTTKIYDILVEKKETTFYANDIMLEIKLSYETLYACYNEKPVAYISNLGGFYGVKATSICDEHENYFVFGYRTFDESTLNKGIMTTFVGHIHSVLNNHFSSYVSVIMNNVWVGCLFPDYYENIDYIPFEIASGSNEPTV